tara:strand:- start:164 stop:1273 length:1110 start_codon:yes stop_codon:yes gene_type:complete
MPRIESNRNLTIDGLVTRLTDHKVFGTSDSIVIESPFQRGDEATGIWCEAKQCKLVDSVQQHFPIGNITLVKNHDSAMSYNEPWQVLDGGNRARSLRDYTVGTITDNNGRKYLELDAREQARFDNIHIQITWITIERNDPPTIISDMFNRLNTTSSQLSHGELVKARGWKGNIPEIEMAKKLIGCGWMTDCSCQSVAGLRKKWVVAFGELGETKRCDNLAMICGFIISAKEGNFAYFEKKYSVISPMFTNPLCPTEKHAMTQKKQDNVVKKLTTFVDLMKEIPLTFIGKCTKGIPAKFKVAPFWKRICEDKMTPQYQTKMILFYKKILIDADLRNRYISLSHADGNKFEVSTSKLDNVLEMIDEWNPDE